MNNRTPLTRDELISLLQGVNDGEFLSSSAFDRIEATANEGFREEIPVKSAMVPGPHARELAYDVILEGAKTGQYRVRLDENGNNYFVDCNTHERIY